MKNTFKSIILALVLSITFLQVSAWNPFEDNNGEIPYCTGENCGYQAGVDQVQNVLTDVEKTKTFSQYIQDIIIYLLTFVTIVAVIYIIYAGFRVLTSNGNEDSLKKSKNTIIYVTLGIVIMWLAYPIVKWIIDVLNLGATNVPTP
nr:hypothetical protein [Candidatus Gracilibacteria bacterium]